MIERLLALCARVDGHPAQRRRLTHRLRHFDQWERLLQHAEGQGLSPLLHRHLSACGISLPLPFRRMLAGLVLRHRRANAIRLDALAFLLQILANRGVEALVLKGAALASTLYPDPGLRPMGDVDILVRMADLPETQAALWSLGYRPDAGVPTPADHYHLPPMQRVISGLNICVEVHHHLLPLLPRYRRLTFETLRPRAVSFDLQGSLAWTLGDADMLWHLYQHGFCMPLVYLAPRLIAAADITGLVESRLGQIEWALVKATFPQLTRVLPLFHFLSPWSPAVIDHFGWTFPSPPRGVGKPFNGWPRRHLSESREKGRFETIRDTLFPPEWWIRMYYGGGIGDRWHWHRWMTHPWHVLWWVRVYRGLFIRHHLPRIQTLLGP